MALDHPKNVERLASLGVPAHHVDRANDIAPAIEAGIASGMPNLIEIPVSAS
jgi:benzoylformate decarboxylase